MEKTLIEMFMLIGRLRTLQAETAVLSKSYLITFDHAERAITKRLNTINPDWSATLADDDLTEALAPSVGA